MTDPLADLAARAAGDPFFLGFALAEYARARGWPTTGSPPTSAAPWRP